MCTKRTAIAISVVCNVPCTISLPLFPWKDSYAAKFLQWFHPQATRFCCCYVCYVAWPWRTRRVRFRPPPHHCFAALGMRSVLEPLSRFYPEKFLPRAAPTLKTRTFLRTELAGTEAAASRTGGGHHCCYSSFPPVSLARFSNDSPLQRVCVLFWTFLYPSSQRIAIFIS